jgi:hypothetical protein
MIYLQKKNLHSGNTLLIMGIELCTTKNLMGKKRVKSPDQKNVP